MSATLAKSAAPPWAITIWRDATNIYTEVPNKAPNGVPFIASYPLSEAGLGKALDQMRTRYNSSASPVYRPESLRASNLKPLVGTASQQATAASILRKMGIIP